MRAGAEQGAATVNQRRGHNHRLAPEVVANQTEADPARRGHKEREAQDQRGAGRAQMEFMCDADEQERVENKIEKVENPCAEAQNDDTVMEARQSRNFVEQRTGLALCRKAAFFYRRHISCTRIGCTGSQSESERPVWTPPKPRQVWESTGKPAFHPGRPDIGWWPSGGLGSNWWPERNRPITPAGRRSCSCSEMNVRWFRAAAWE